MLTQEQAEAALRALPRPDREWVLSLPSKEAMAVIKLLVAFPGTRFEP